MAKKVKNNSKTSKISLFLHDERFRFSLGIVLFLSTIYLGLALVSFFFTGDADQSIVLADSAARVEMKGLIENWTGYRGAIIAEYLVNNSFGLSTYVLLLIPFALSMYLIKVPFMKMWKAFLFPILFVLWGPVMLDFFFGAFCEQSFINIGGAYGNFVDDVLIANVGKPGTFFIILGVLLVFCVFTFSVTVSSIRALLIRKGKKESESSVLNFAQSDEPEEETQPAVRIGDKVVPDEWMEKEENDEILSSQTPSANNIITIDGIEIVSTRTDDDPVEANMDEVRNEGIEVERVEEAGDEPFDERKEDDIVVEIEEAKPASSGDVEVLVVENSDGEMVLENMKPYDPTEDLSMYEYPTLDLLKQYQNQNAGPTEDEQKKNQSRIIETLRSFKIEVKKIYETIGPTVTLYEIVPQEGVRVNKIKNLEDDIMMSLSANGIRIIAPMPGRGTIGIEVPNSNPKIVSMHSVIASKKFQEMKAELPVALGRTISNDVFTFDLAKMPHLLVAGATGQGKSVGLNAIITSLLYKKHPSQLKFVLVDPKKVEFSIFSEIERHFLAKIPDVDEPVITDTSKVVETLNSLCKEMDSRYDLLKTAHARNIKEYNEKFVNRILNPLKGHRYLPYIVVIVDEFGDLIMTAGKEVELPIARIAQLARAVGIHMIIATQRPSTNIITGVIKANFPAQIAFKVANGYDSKTIIDQPGAQQLIGKGDLLFKQGSTFERVQCAFVDTPEVEDIVNFVAKQQSYPAAFELPEPDMPDSDNNAASVDLKNRDELFDVVARFVVETQQGTTSNVQRKFGIGFNRAGRIVDQLEVAGIVGPQRGPNKPREVLVHSDYELQELLARL